MKKGLLLVNNNVEDGEALFTRALLKRAGYQITTFTMEDNLKLKTAYELDFYADKYISEVKEEDYDFIVLPGGSHVFDWINKSEDLNYLLEEFNESQKLIAAICAAPLFLGKINLLKDREYTVFPGVEKEITHGIYIKDKKVVKTDNIITARSAGVIYDFVFMIIKTVENEEKVKKMKKSIVF